MGLVNSSHLLLPRTKSELIAQLEIVSKSHLLKPLIVKNDGRIARVNFLIFFFEKLKGRLGGQDRTNRFFIEYKTIQLLAWGKKWITPQDTKIHQLIKKVASRQGLTPDNRCQHLELAAVVEEVCKNIYPHRIPRHLLHNFSIRHQKELKPYIREIEQTLWGIGKRRFSAKKRSEELVPAEAKKRIKELERSFIPELSLSEKCLNLPIKGEETPERDKELPEKISEIPSRKTESTSIISDLGSPLDLEKDLLFLLEKKEAPATPDLEQEIKEIKVERKRDLEDENVCVSPKREPTEEMEDFFNSSPLHQSRIWELFVENSLRDDETSQANAHKLSLILNRETIKNAIPSLFLSYDLVNKMSFIKSKGWKFVQSCIGKKHVANLAVIEDVFEYFLERNHGFCLLILVKSLIRVHHEMYREIIKKASSYFTSINKTSFALKLARKCVKVGLEIDPMMMESTFASFICKKRFDLALKLTLACVGKDEESLLVEKAFNTFMSFNQWDHALNIALAYVDKDDEVHARILENTFDAFLNVKAFKQALKLALKCLETDKRMSSLIAIHAYFIFDEQDKESQDVLVEACHHITNAASGYILSIEKMKREDKGNVKVLSLCYD